MFVQKKVLLIFGTRPEAIKLVSLIKRLKSSECVNLKICISAQHRDMLDSVLKEYSIVPDYDLDVMRSAQTLDYITSEILSKTGKVIDSCSPDLILVHGDTTTAFVSALAGFYRKIPIGHIEAGLRSRNILSPYPEEFNRRAISIISSYHFAPTDTARNALLSEGIPSNRIFTVGNTAIDTLKYNLSSATPSNFVSSTDGHPYILITVHRREHDEKELSDIFFALKRLCCAHPEMNAIYPLHKNPRLRDIATTALKNTKNLLLCDPLETKAFHHLLSKAYMVLTDSGGIQEEAAFLGKPTLVLRDTTERPEGVEAGVLRLVGSDPNAIFENADTLLGNRAEYDKMAIPTNVFGDGLASKRIAEIIENL